MARIPIRAASDVLASFMDRDLADKAERASGFFRSWKQVVGERLSAHSRVAEVERGIVIVEADHPSWIQLLQMRQEEILSAIKRDWPELKVRAVAFRLGSGELPRPAAGTERTLAKTDEGEPDTMTADGRGDGEAAAEGEGRAGSAPLKSIKDERLKSALERLRESVKRKAGSRRGEGGNEP